jgi:RNA polymerase sigma-70 factor (ECF subfamily)
MSATEEAWVRLRRSLLGFFRRRVGDEHDAEDLLQETFVRVHDGLARLAPVDRLAPWVWRVARNVLADRLREGGRAEVQAELDDVADPARPEANLNAEVERWLRAWIALLPSESREAVELTELGGLGQREVALRLGLSLSAAKSRVQRGRRRLRAMLLACCHLDFDAYGNVVGYARRGGCDGGCREDCEQSAGN